MITRRPHFQRRHRLLGLLKLTLAILLSPIAGRAAELSGVLLYSCAKTADPDECRADAQTVAWHTTIDDTAAPLLVLPGLLPANSFKPPANESGDLRFPLPHGITLLTLLFQPEANQFPPRVGVNLYFNGDQLTPGAAAIVPTWAGPALTRFWPNLSPTIPSLYLRDAEGPGSVTYSDGHSLVEITALLVSPAQAVARIDRVGTSELRPDGALDAVIILELTATPISWRRDNPLAPVPQTAPVIPPPGVILRPVDSPAEPISTATGLMEASPTPAAATTATTASTPSPRTPRTTTTAALPSPTAPRNTPATPLSESSAP